MPFNERPKDIPDILELNCFNSHKAKSGMGKSFVRNKMLLLTNCNKFLLSTDILIYWNSKANIQIFYAKAL